MPVRFGSKGPKPLGSGRFRCGSYPDGSPARTAFNGIVLHTSEQARDRFYPDNAEALCQFLATPATADNVAGYNAVADTDGWWDLCADDCRAFAAPPTNGTMLHICFPVRYAGSSQGPALTRADWLGELQPFIDVAASYIVVKSRRYGTPLIRRTPAELSSGLKGYADHHTVSKAWGRTDHTDVDGFTGAFPWDHLAEEIRRQNASDPPPTVPEEETMFRRRFRGYHNTFLVPGCTSLTPEEDAALQAGGVPIVVSGAHGQTWKSTLFQSGLSASDMVRKDDEVV